jgi:hypothetical protein
VNILAAIMNFRPVIICILVQKDIALQQRSELNAFFEQVDKDVLEQELEGK